MRINFFATIRLLVGKKTVIVSIKEKTTFKSLLEDVYLTHPNLKNMLTDESGKIRGSIHVFINREAHLNREELESRVVGNDDVVDIFPAVAGGRSLM